jgi:hypothetical protein
VTATDAKVTVSLGFHWWEVRGNRTAQGGTYSREEDAVRIGEQDTEIYDFGGDEAA